MTSADLCAHREADSAALLLVALVAPKGSICVAGVKAGFIIIFNRLDVDFLNKSPHNPHFLQHDYL